MSALRSADAEAKKNVTVTSCELFRSGGKQRCSFLFKIKKKLTRGEVNEAEDKD